MKMLLTSDWHLDAVTSGLGRYSDVARAVYQTVEYAIDRDFDFYVFAGDLSDPDSQMTLAAVSASIDVSKKLTHAGIPSLWIPGNHDVLEAGGGWTTLSPLDRVGNSAAVVGLPSLARFAFDGRDWVVGCLPYVERSLSYDPEKVIEGWHSSGHDIDFFVGHLCIAGIHPGSETTEMPRGRDVYFPLDTINRLYPRAHKFNGHYHEQQVFKGIHIPGSLERLTFGEERNKPGFLTVDL